MVLSILLRVGLLRYYFNILFALSLFAGCGSVIKVPESNLDYSHKMFGKDGARDFYYKGNFPDSLKLSWIGETHGGFTNTSITVKNGFVFVSDLSGFVFCFDFVTGKEIGQIKTKGIISSSVITNSNKIIFPVQFQNANYSSVIYYDIKNGEETKNIKLPGKLSSELILENDEIICISQEGRLYVLNLKGEQVWSFDFNKMILSPPVSSGSLVCVISADGTLYVLDTAQKKVLSTLKLDGNYEAGLVIKNSVLYCGNNEGIISAIDLTKDKILWQFDTKYRIKSFPVIDSENIYVANLRGQIYALSSLTGKMLWKTETNGLFESSPIVTDNYLIVPDQDKKLLFIAKDSGKIIKSLLLEGRNKLSPVIINSSLFIGYEKGKIAKYEFVK